jgi:putative membrane protein
MTEPSSLDPDVAGPAEAHSRVDDPRVYLAAERTFLAWVRTSLALMGFGFLIARFAFLIRETEGLSILPHPKHHAVSPWLGFFMVCFGVAVCLVSLLRHRAYVEALDSGVPNPRLNVRAPLVIAAVLALVGLAMAIHILTL